MNASILVIDDEPAICVALKRLLSGCGYHVTTVGSGHQAQEELRRHDYQLVITDLTLEPMSGMEILAWIQQHFAGTEREDSGGAPKVTSPSVIMITAYGSERTAVEAMKLGALDYLPKPFDNDELVLVVRRVLEEHRLRSELQQLRQEVGERYRFHQLIGRSPAMVRVFERIRKVADTDLTVMVRGASGTGKELVANAIHYNSPRRHRPLVKVNCAAFARDLVESELFGHEQGAFTGATRARQGKFEAADGGTLFLDEIGDMGLETQAKVLRVLQEKTFERVGGNRTLKVDVRILAATNHDLEALIESGGFRRDLYYRLNVVTVELPSLQERPEDLTLLVDHFLEKASQRLDRPRPTMGSQAMRALVEHPWQGNVRELEHAIEHAVALAGGEEITLQDLPPTVLRCVGTPANLHQKLPQDFKAAKEQMITTFERDFICAAMRRHGGNITRAAEEMGMYRQHLQMKLGKLAIDPADYR